jgi:hypothetical protein
LFKLFHILTTNIIQYVIYDSIVSQCNKSTNFVELMLESWNVFLKNVVLINIIKFILLNKKLHFKGLERSIRDTSAKNDII